MTNSAVPNVHPGIASLRPYQPGKPVDELARELGLTDIVKLASNENPRGPGPRVQEAITRELKTLSRYPDGNGYVLKQALLKHLQVQPQQLTLGNGSNDVLDLITRVAVEPGYEAVVSAHSFVVYRLAVTCAGGQLIEVPAQNYGADLAAMAAAVTDRTRAVFLANPNNPTGTWVNHDAVVEFLDSVPSHVWVVLDEAYAEYTHEPAYPRSLELLARYPNLIVTRTFSKIHGLAALRVGYSISSTAFADLLNRARQPFNVSSVGLAAAAAALDDQEFVSESVALNNAGMQQVTAGLNTLGLEYIPSLGNFVCFNCGKDAQPVYQALLQQGVIVRPIAEYGMPHHLRVSIGLASENERFLRALPKALD
jgi:histidinol-phosphate aminotransferase